VAVNLALYGPGGGRWAMTERGRGALSRSPSRIAIGPSAIEWDGHSLRLSINEWAVPWPARIRGSIRLHPLAITAAAPFALDRRADHHWWPIAPCSRVDVELDDPRWRWRGNGYLDSNRGRVPLEQTFSDWQWARAASSSRRGAVVYDATELDGRRSHLALGFDARGRCQAFDAPPPQPLPNSAWRLPRSQRSEPGTTPILQRTWEDTPFYARSLVRSQWGDDRVLAVHESLSLSRFRQPWVQAMLPFRMPRRAG
jgi:carotenoid 1,2-hydratase